MRQKICYVCASDDLVKINTYKHYAYVCSDCNCVSHEKKDKYFLEYIFPAKLFKKWLPEKAFLRLFHDDNSFAASSFYDVFADECENISDARKAEMSQLLDQFDKVNIDLNGKAVLDISGGPGYIGNELNKMANEVVVTEYSEKASSAMANKFGIKTKKFDYNSDDISSLFSKDFDLILVRSSIIFCKDLDQFVFSLSKILKEDGIVLIETILPTLGEIFWWQQLEYKFPLIYSQETIEKVFFKNGFSLAMGYRDYGGYLGVKKRSYRTLSKHMFTWLIDFPMVALYYLLSLVKRPAIDQSMRHKVLTQFWVKRSDGVCVRERSYLTYSQGGKNKSKTFGYLYNGYLNDD